MVNQLIDPDSVTGKDNRQLANAINHVHECMHKGRGDMQRRLDGISRNLATLKGGLKAYGSIISVLLVIGHILIAKPWE